MDEYPENENEKKADAPALEPWQNPPDPELALDLDFAEIAALNRLEDEEEPPQRGLFWPLLVMAVLLLILFQAYIFHDAINNFLYAQKIIHTEIPQAYADNPVMTTAREAVVLIRGDGARGSGFNIDPSGLVVTNRHVMENESAVRVYFPDGSDYLCTKWRTLPDSDLAVLRLEGQDLPFISLAAGALTAEQEVYFIGSPESSWWMMTEGVVGQFYPNSGGYIVSISLDRGIGPGASGSPVLNRRGEAGAVVFAVSSSDERQAFAIPIGVLRQYLAVSGYY